MINSRKYMIELIDEYSPQISYLLSMMKYTRDTTLNTVKGLTSIELDYLHDKQSNSIGMLLFHMAAVENAYQINTFEGRSLTETEKEKWNIGLQLGENARMMIKGKELEYYLEILNEVRQRTLDNFKQVDDKWLHEIDEYNNGEPINRYFKWFHVFEDELNHRGQIRWIRRRAIRS